MTTTKCELESVEHSRDKKSIMKFAELISIIAFVYCLSLLYNVLEVAIYELDGTIQPLNNWDQMDTNKLIFTHMFVHLFFSSPQSSASKDAFFDQLLCVLFLA